MTADTMRQKWNARYSNSDVTIPEPAWVLTQYDYLLPPGGHALELACGLGGNAIRLAEKGFMVTAWDISDVAIRTLQNFSLSRNLMLNAEIRDVEREPPEPASQDVIVVSNFLHLPLMRHIVDALRPGGVVYYQTWSIDRPPGMGGPSNPDFLLKRNELLQAFSLLDVLVFHDEGLAGDLNCGLRGQSAIVARKPA